MKAVYNRICNLRDRYKLLILYILLFIQTMILGHFLNLYDMYNPQLYAKKTGAISIISIVFVIVVSKILKVNYKNIIKFWVVILVLLSCLIIDNGYLYSSYIQSTYVEVPILSYFTPFIYLILIPFRGIFDLAYLMGVYKLSYIIVPSIIALVGFGNSRLLRKEN